MRNWILGLFVFIFFSSCEKNSDGNASGTGTGGSLARFTVIGNYLYIADWNTVKVYDVSNPARPDFRSSVNINFGVETIFPFGDKIFIGSPSGMFVYKIKSRGQLELLGQAGHFRSCDPVVANDRYAFVTLRAGASCGVGTSGLYSYDITNIKSPSALGILELSDPYGLGLKDSIVFVCRDTGLSVVNVHDAVHPKIIQTFTGSPYRDVIVHENLLICYVTDGLLLYDISNMHDIRRVGEAKYL